MTPTEFKKQLSAAMDKIHKLQDRNAEERQALQVMLDEINKEWNRVYPPKEGN